MLRTTRKSFLLDEKIMVFVLGVFVFFLIINAGKSYASGIAAAKERHASELSLLLESASVADGNFFVKYPNDLSQYYVKITNKEVIVSEDNLFDASSGRAQFVSSRSQYVNEEFVQPMEMYIFKIGNRLYIDDETPNINQWECPDISTSNPQWIQSKIFVHGNDPEVVTLLREPSAIDFSALVDGHLEVSENYLFIMGLSSLRDEGAGIKAYYLVNGLKPIESKKLGCLLLNEWGKTQEIRISLIPITPESLANDDPKLAFFTDQEILRMEIPMVFIETNIAQKDPASFKSGFEKALVRYYT